MSDEGDNENNLPSRHRRERKELQSKIQFLKKSASKGDKKKRKEILDEVAKIELELAKRHAEELNDANNAKNINAFSNNEQLQSSTVNDNEKCDSSNENNDCVNLDAGKLNSHEIRISKAQRRRDKKAEKEKDKAAEIAAQELLNQNGPRATEIRAIKDILTKRGLNVYSIPSDGDCLYSAICHQMTLIGQSITKSENISDDINLDQIKYLRNETANYIEKNKERLIFYMTSQGTEDVMTNEEFDGYCHKIRNTSAWGGQLEIRALANILKVRIEVLQANGPPTIQEYDDSENTGPTLVIIYHRHMYSLGEHYNSTTPLVEEQQDECTANNEDS